MYKLLLLGLEPSFANCALLNSRRGKVGLMAKNVWEIQCMLEYYRIWGVMYLKKCLTFINPRFSNVFDSLPLSLSLFLCLSVFLSIFVMKFPRWDTKFEKWKCWVRLFILAFIGHRPCVWKWARLTKRRQIRHSAPSWKASRGDAMQMILQSCFVLFFNCGKTGDKATERKRREVRNMSGKASLVRKSHVSIHSCNVRY